MTSTVVTEYSMVTNSTMFECFFPPILSSPPSQATFPSDNVTSPVSRYLYIALDPLGTRICRLSSVVRTCVVLTSLHSVMLRRTGSWMSNGSTSLLCPNAPYTAFIVNRFFLQTVAWK